VDVHNAYAFALLVVGRGDEEAEIEPHPDRQNGQPTGPRQQPVGEAHEAAGVGETVQGHLMLSFAASLVSHADTINHHRRPGAALI
jgi:hypothetical protein